MKQILKTLVGSRAHGTALPDSDWDYRGVFMVPVEDFISPFRNVKNNSWIEGKEDNTSYELTHFVKMCAHGNPSALELLVAPEVESTVEGRRLRAMLPCFLSERVITSFMGYSRSQEKKFRDNHMDRRWKYAEAHTRTLYQLHHLLLHNELKIGWEGGVLDELCFIKRGQRRETDIMDRIFQLENLCEIIAAQGSHSLPKEPDTEAIEEFLFEMYLSNKCHSPEAEVLGSGEKNKSLPILEESPLSNQ